MKKELIGPLHRIDEFIRDSERLVLSRSASDRVDLLKDYMYIGLAVLGALATIFATDNGGIIRSDLLLVSGVISTASVVVYSLVARIYLIANIETAFIFVENSFAKKYEIVEEIAICENLEEMKGHFAKLDEIRDFKLNNKKWPDVAHVRIAALFIFGVLLILSSFILPLRLETTWLFIQNLFA